MRGLDLHTLCQVASLSRIECLCMACVRGDGGLWSVCSRLDAHGCFHCGAHTLPEDFVLICKNAHVAACTPAHHLSPLFTSLQVRWQCGRGLRNAATASQCLLACCQQVPTPFQHEPGLVAMEPAQGGRVSHARRWLNFLTHRISNLISTIGMHLQGALVAVISPTAMCHDKANKRMHDLQHSLSCCLSKPS